MTDYSKLWSWSRCRPELLKEQPLNITRVPPAHKQTNPVDKPGQIVNPIPKQEQEKGK